MVHTPALFTRPHSTSGGQGGGNHGDNRDCKSSNVDNGDKNNNIGING